MTTLGKILVIANLVFSVATGFLVLMVYAARTNWHAAYEKLEKNVKVAQANASTYLAESEEVRKKADAEIKKLSDELVQAKSDREKASKAATEAIARFDQQQKINLAAGASQTGLTEELARRKNEIDLLKNQQGVNERKMLDLEKEKKDYRDRAVSAELASKSEQERNTNLLSQIETLNREISRLQTTGTGRSSVTSDRRPPPEDVEGLVLDRDQATGYITISIGSDAGLSRGNTLQAYRLKPEPKYLGMVQILEVRPDRAVAKPLDSRRGPILVGDTVATNINSKR